MTKKETEAFFNRPADTVARELLGSVLCVRQEDGGIVRHEIHETEAYMGPHDLACHAAKGRTKRTEVLYREAGTIYIYLIYGMYTMLNIVTGAEEYPAAVLLCGAGVYDGPGKLTRALNIGMEYNGTYLGNQGKQQGNTKGIWIELPAKKPTLHIVAAPRIGVDYAGVWAGKPLRFISTPEGSS